MLLAAFRRVEVATLAPLNYLQLLMAVLISAAWFGRTPDGPALAGMAVIAGAGLWLALNGARRKVGLAAATPQTAAAGESTDAITSSLAHTTHTTRSTHKTHATSTFASPCPQMPNGAPAALHARPARPET